MHWGPRPFKPDLAADGGVPVGGAFTELLDLVFDPLSYAHFYEDLQAASGADPTFHFTRHFIQCGAAEGRSPSIYFDVDYVQRWLARSDSVAIEPGEVFARFAALPTAARFVPNRWFSPWVFRQSYGKSYAGLATCSDYDLFVFYMQKAAVAALSPCGAFHEAAYRARYPDVAAAIERGEFRSGFQHFVLFGAAESRDNLPGFGNAAEEAAWLLSGQAGLERGVWWFDEAFYLSAYDSVHELVRRGHVKSGLEHYLIAGLRQGRVPNPALFERLPKKDVEEPWTALEASLANERPRSTKITMACACAVLEHVITHEGTSAKRRVTEALWPLVEKPAVMGTFDARRYLATNSDLAPSVDAEEHWRKIGFYEDRIAPGTNPFGDRAVQFADVLAWKSGVNFFGPVSAMNGLGNAARGYAEALRAVDVPLNVYDTSALLHPHLFSDLAAAEDLAYSINFFCLNADQVLTFARKYGFGIFHHRANVLAPVWELAAPRPEWRSGLSAFDLIVTPSRFCASSFELTTDLPIETVPYVVDAAALREAAATTAPNPWIAQVEAAKQAGQRVVLFVMDASSYTARKGVDRFHALVERVQASRPGQCLFVLKSHSRDISLRQPGVQAGGCVLTINSILNFTDLCRLKAAADVYVSPHRSEGFGLNIAESILLGVPALCSAYGGATDLLGEDYPYLINGALAEVGSEMGPYGKHAIWFEPDVEDLAAKLIALLFGPSDHQQGGPARPNPTFLAAAERLQAALAPKTVGTQLRDALVRFCAYGAEHAANPLQAFAGLATARHDECFSLGHVEKETQHSPDTPGLERLAEIAMAAMRPHFSIVTPTFNTQPAWLEELYDDLLHQSDPAWEWCICDDGSTRADTLAALRALRRRDARIKLKIFSKNRGISAATNAAAAIATGKHLIFIDHDDRVVPELLATYHHVLQDDETPCVLYSDEDKLDASGRRCDPYHKPDWSPEHILSCMYVLHCLCVRKSLFLELGGYRTAYDGAQDHDFVLRASRAGAPIRHVDRILYHWRISPNSAAATIGAKGFEVAAGHRAVADHLQSLGLEAKVESGLVPGTYRVRPKLRPGRVALNILTGCKRRDGGSVTYAEHFVRSILAHEPDVDFEIRVVTDRAQLALARPLGMLDRRVQIVPYDPGPCFNFSEKANFAISGCEMERVVLLNDDMEAIDNGWLRALLEMLELPGVGVVGGQLLYPDDTVQHCGIVLGVMDGAAHLFVGKPAREPSYNAFMQIVRNYSAVTGAMLAVRRSTFEAVGGFDPSYPLDYNDVDFCLRTAEMGLRTVFTPFAQLRHFESRSLPRLVADGLDRLRFTKRWSGVMARDPYYNRNLSRKSANCEPILP
ncbi:glycosyltransferase [Methylovirgula sp. 4M-Z18]|uniref:glycosyltransferase n=1 Tax=Methylovirgula sp. 4M-Z18 TaxID=2293567 RepID=UPI000E2EFAEE|nr:glycosyltransferase [Methylovirgula sp. 4M-Z18]RFB79821.1 glycosyltransferase [Methylovirgula sp. 4M-Z18]